MNRSLLFWLLFIFAVINQTLAQTAVSYTGMGSITCPAAPTATISPAVSGLTFSQLSRGAGVTCVSAATGISGSGFNGSLATNVTGSRWYTLNITSDASVSFVVNSLSVVSQVSGTVAGNSVDIQYSINGGAKTSVGSFTPTTTSTAYNITPSSAISVGASQTLNLFFIPNGLSAAGTTCRINNNTSITVTTTSACTAPTTQSSGFSSSSITGTSATISWSSNGDGTNRIVLLKSGSAVSSSPSSGTAYTANAAFGSGSQIGTGNYVVYDGTGSSVSITGLSTGTTYYAAVYEYNATGTCYLTTSPLTGNFTTSSVPTITTTNSISSITNTTATSGGTTITDGGSAITAKGVCYNTATGPTTANSITSDGTGTANFTSSLTSLSPQTRYYVRAYATNAIGTGYGPEVNFRTFSNPPTAQATAFSVTAATSSSLTLGWTAATFPGSGATTMGYVLLRATSPAVPVFSASNGQTPSASTGTVVSSSITSATTTYSDNSLTAGTTYNYLLIPFCWDGTNATTYHYLTTAAPTCSGTTYSSSSDFIAVASSESATISSLENTAGPLTSTQGAQVWQFTVRDGGAGLNDADSEPTIVTGLTFTQAATNAMNTWSDAIQSIDLFDGTTNVGTGTASATQVVFTGLNITVADNTSKTLTLRLSLKCGVGNSGNIDGDDFGFSLTRPNFTVSSSGSGKAGTITTISSADAKNVFTVTATQLTFSQQPTSTAMNTSMSPSVTVKATDACGNTDIGHTGTVSITSTGTLSSSPATAALSSGVATFSLTHTAAGSNFTLTATLAPLTSATSSTFNITVSTNFDPGDFAIVAVNTQRNASGSADEVCFVTFKDIVPGTSFEITDNGYERATAGTWGDTEGTMRFTRSASATTITAGTVICIEGPSDSYDDVNVNDYDIYVCGVKDDANWSSTVLSGSVNGMDWNSSDQVWIMQGGSWNVIAGTHNDTYTGGNIIYGWTAIPWEAAPGYASTSGSTLYPNKDCFNTDVATPGDKTKYTGPTTAATKFEWIARINNETNWTNYADNTTYDASGTNYYGGSCATTALALSAATESEGTWKGIVNQNWFDCANWDTKEVPDSTVDVTINASAGNDCTIDRNGFSASAALYGSIAKARSLTINGRKLNLKYTGASTNELRVYGNITINSTDGLNMDDGVAATADGVLKISGNWNNLLTEADFDEGEGTVVFIGSTDQSINNAGAFEQFYNFTNNKTGGAAVLNDPVNISKALTLTSRNINTTSTNLLTMLAGSTASGASDNSHIDGPMKKVGNTAFEFPVGDAGIWAPIAISAPTNATTQYTAEYFYSPSPFNNASYMGTGVSAVSNVEYWDLSRPVGTAGADDVFASLYWKNGTRSFITDTADLLVAHYNSTITKWEDMGGVASGNTTAGFITSTVKFASFSPASFGSAANVNPLPISLIDFSAIREDKKVNVRWITKSEIENDFFTVLKSYDGKEFNGIGEIDGNGTTNGVNGYHFIDYEPSDKVTYYCLKQTDFNGTSTLSQIVAVDPLFNKESLSIINIFQSSHNDLEIMFMALENSMVTAQIFDLKGTLISSQILNAKDGYNLISAPLSESSSVYFIRLTDGNTSVSRKTIIR